MKSTAHTVPFLFIKIADHLILYGMGRLEMGICYFRIRLKLKSLECSFVNNCYVPFLGRISVGWLDFPFQIMKKLFQLTRIPDSLLHN